MNRHLVTISVSLLLSLPALAAPAGQTEFNIREYGAVGNGTNLDSSAINQAIEAAAAAGGGTVFVPAGGAGGSGRQSVPV